MERENGNKALRVLSMYQKLMNNQIVNKAEEAAAYGVNSRTIQRNIDDIRGFLETTDSAGISKQIVYDQKERGYRLEEVYDENLTAGEALDVCKILIDSRAFPKDKMKKLIYQIVGSSVPEPEQKHIYELVNNELFHYIEPRHKTDCSEMLWQIGEAVHTNHYIEIEYQRTKDKSIVTRRLRPAAIMFSEYYFYIVSSANVSRETIMPRCLHRFPHWPLRAVLPQGMPAPTLAGSRTSSFRRRPDRTRRTPAHRQSP